MTRNDYNPPLNEDSGFGPCIGCLEFATIPRGVEAADVILPAEIGRAHV